MPALRVAVIGTGSTARKHSRILDEMEGVEIAGVLSRDAARAHEMARYFPGCRGYDDLSALITEIRPDAAFICTIPAAHGDIERMLIDHGVPFFVEKPLGVDLRTPEEIAEAVERANLITSVGFHMRYRDSVHRGLELLRNRSILAAAGFWMAGLPSPSWWNNPALSGGQLIERTSHIFDLIRYLCGEATDVSAAENNPAAEHADARVPVAGAALCVLESGAVATVTNSCAMDHGHRIGLDIFTREGTLYLEQHRGVFDGRGGRIEVRDSADPFVREDAAFLDAVRSGERSGILSPYRDALETQRLSVTAARSVQA